jgi:hypothetical protein
VLHAACQEEALVPYQPFVEALRGAGLDRRRIAGMPGAGELARLIPELPAQPDTAPADAELRRYLLFEAVSALLDGVAAQAPLALVIDDLHWADRATLDLLRHVARPPQEAALLIVGTYRDAEVGADHPLADLLADSRRDRVVERLTLEGLPSATWARSSPRTPGTQLRLHSSAPSTSTPTATRSSSRRCCAT